MGLNIVAVAIFILATIALHAICCSAFSFGSRKPIATMTMMEGSPLSTDRRSFLKHATVGLGGIAVAPAVSIARPEGVNKPELLPSEQTNVIDTVKMLTKGQVGRLDKLLAKLEKDTGYKLRVLCQSYPNTPGLAIRDFWGVDEKTVVLVADEGTFGRNAARGPANLLNFNVGSGLDLALPARFWVRLQSEYGNKFFVEDVGKDQAVLTAVEAIAYCLRQGYCVDVPKELGGGKLGGF